ncbi:hypothetical protein Tco_0008970 [Tanacetum coccineum]
MANLKFVDTHNMVTFLSKPAKREGFEQIVDFLNAHTIKYALTINPTIYTSCIEQFWANVKAKTINGEVQLQALVDGKKIIITESIVRRDLQLENADGVDSNVADEAVKEEMDDSLERAATTATGLDAEQDRGNIDKTQSKATLNESSSSGTSSGSGPKRQETIGDTIAQTSFENVSKTSNDPLLARGKTLRSGEDRLKLKELMVFCTTLQNRVLALETTKNTQANEIDSLKRRVKRLEKKDRKRTHKLKRLYKVGLTARVESSNEEGLGEEDTSKQGRRIHEINADEDITLVNDQDNADMFGVNDLDGDELVSAAEETVNAAATTVSTASMIPVTDVEITFAQALVELKSAKPKADKVVIQKLEQGITTPTVSSQQPSQVKAQDKGKRIMVEEPVVEQVKPMKRLEQMRLDEELAFKLQAEEEEEESLAREKAQQVEEANIAWDDVQSKIEADYQLAQGLQAQEQKELTDAEKARLFVQFLKQRRKHFAAKRAEEKRNKPPTKA